jgi:hypothetical protein
MAYNAGQGTSLRMGAAAGGTLPAPGSDTFTVLPLVGKITPPSNVRKTTSFSVLNSPDPLKVGGGFEERTVKARIVYDEADVQQAQLFADSVTPGSTAARRNWRIILAGPLGRAINFVGFVQKLEWEDVESEKEIAINLEIAVDGLVTGPA